MLSPTGDHRREKLLREHVEGMKSKASFFLRSPSVVFSAGICYEHLSLQTNTGSGKTG
jgi:hypothetical protein